MNAPNKPYGSVLTLEMVVEALRSGRVDIEAYEADQRGEDFDPASIEIDEEEIAYLRWKMERNRG